MEPLPPGETAKKRPRCKFNLRYLRISLKHRPEILKLLLIMRKTNMKKTTMLKKVKHDLAMLKKIYTPADSSKEKDSEERAITKDPETIDNTEASVAMDVDLKPALKTSFTQTETSTKNSSTQTDDEPNNMNNIESKTSNTISVATKVDSTEQPSAWDIGNSGEETKSIADQVKEVAQSAMQQSGMVYVETAGMYYDYKTGYYYNSELGLYYHPDTGCYYRYTEDKKEFVFHSYPDQRAVAANASLLAHEKRKAKKHKKEEDQATKPKRKKEEKKASKEKNNKNNTEEPKMVIDAENKNTQEKIVKTVIDGENKDTIEKIVEEKAIEDKVENSVSKEVDLEDGECSETASEAEQSDGDESNASTSTASDDDAVAKHHPPCMRIIVRETKLPKLKVGSLYLVTKDGGTIGREGEQHTIVIKDNNVSRNHLDIRYDMERRLYLATDLGSKNGTLLNGIQMSESQIVSQPMEVIHGSVIQLGETKLLCHIHPGNDTCGHCEPGLIMETQEKAKVAYTRVCSVKKQHELELARLKNKYAPQPLMIEEGTYNDRAKARRETVGSSHHSEKTESADVDTCIAPENKGFKLLEKMGWSKGEGLGKERQGETEPVPLVSNEGTAGLGTGAVGAPKPPPPRPRNKLGSSTLRLAARSKLLQPPAKAFLDPLEDDD